jgi:hypothetical protein
MTEVKILDISVREYLDLKKEKGFPIASELVVSKGLDPIVWEASVIHWVVSAGNWEYGITRDDLERMGWIDDIGGLGDEAMYIQLRPTQRYALKPDSVKISE